MHRTSGFSSTHVAVGKISTEHYEVQRIICLAF